MSAAAHRTRASLLRLLLAAVLALCLGLPSVATADEDGGGGRANVAVAENTKDGSSVFDLAFEVRRVSSGVVDQTNAAVAYASCESCQTVAIAIQIVLVSGEVDTLTPTNVAVALNESCTTCQTLALAYQFVFGTGDVLEFSKEGRARLRDIRKELRKLGRAGLSPDEIRARVIELSLDIRDLLATGLVPRKPGDDEDEDRDRDELEEPDEEPSDDLESDDEELEPEDEEELDEEEEEEPEETVPEETVPEETVPEEPAPQEPAPTEPEEPVEEPPSSEQEPPPADGTSGTTP